MRSRLDRGAVRLLTRTGLDWTHKYPALAAAVSSFRGSHVQAAQDEFRNCPGRHCHGNRVGSQRRIG